MSDMSVLQTKLNINAVWKTWEQGQLGKIHLFGSNEKQKRTLAVSKLDDSIQKVSNHRNLLKNPTNLLNFVKIFQFFNFFDCKKTYLHGICIICEQDTFRRF